jgi:flavorubredoxin
MTPHVHHWDSMIVFEETTKSLFPSDLFIQPGDNKPVRRPAETMRTVLLKKEALIELIEKLHISLKLGMHMPILFDNLCMITSVLSYGSEK